MDIATKRVELADGQWADIRTRMLVSDIQHQRKVANERGFADELLDGIAVIETLVTAWSFGEVSREKVNALNLDDALALLRVVTGTDDGRGNGSEPSSAGTRRKAKSAATATPQSSGS